MMSNYKKLLILLALTCCCSLFAQNIQNPVLPKVADAGVMKFNGKYYIGGVFTNGDFYLSDDMFAKFTIEYLRDGKWHSIDNSGAKVAEHPAFNSLSFAPVRAEGVRFINKDAVDLQRHIYKIGIHEMWKESYNFRATRRGEKLYLFVDGHEVGALDIPQFQASRIGLISENLNANYKGILYYHIGK